MPEWLDNIKDNLDESIRDSETLAQVPDIPTLAKSYLDSQSHIGNSIRIPSEEASEDDWGAFNDKLKSKVPTLMNKPDLEDPEQLAQVYEMLGRPQDTKGYEVETDEAMLETAHKLGLSKSQLKGLVDHIGERSTQTSEERAKELKTGHTALSEEWGMAYDQRVATAVATLRKTGAPESLLDAAETGKVGADTIKWAYSVGKALGSENPNFLADGKGGKNAKVTPSEAHSRLTEIRNNKDHAFNDRTNPNHKDALQEVLELTKAANAK